MIVHSKITVENEDIFYFLEETGKQKILFLHGFNSSHNFIFQLKKKQNRNYDIVSFDFPGCGQSTNNNEINVKNYQKVAASFIKKLNLDIQIVIGHSLGGAIALYILSENLAKKAILVAPLNPFILEKNSQSEAEKLSNWLLPQDIVSAKDSLEHLVFTDKFSYKKNLANNAINFLDNVTKKREIFRKIVFEEIFDLEWLKTELLPLYQQNNNYFVIAGVEDHFVPLESLQKISESFNKNLIKFEETGHAVFFERSDEINNQIEKILEI
ncbi:putative esterase/lipase [Mesomycoplasma ovipneumoniae]|nr:putative esterase/lipase [Mesomycoplasma ovipneumoniae]